MRTSLASAQPKLQLVQLCVELGLGLQLVFGDEVHQAPDSEPMLDHAAGRGQRVLDLSGLETADLVVEGLPLHGR